MAREVSRRTGAPLRFPRLAKLEVKPATATQVRVETPLCLVYTVTELFRTRKACCRLKSSRRFSPPICIRSVRRSTRRTSQTSTSSAAAVRDALASAAPAFLREIHIVDLFELPNARAVTFEIEYLSEEALTGDTINAATDAMTAAVTKTFGEQVTQRV